MREPVDESAAAQYVRFASTGRPGTVPSGPDLVLSFAKPSTEGVLAHEGRSHAARHPTRARRGAVAARRAADAGRRSRRIDRGARPCRGQRSPGPQARRGRRRAGQEARGRGQARGRLQADDVRRAPVRNRRRAVGVDRARGEGVRHAGVPRQAAHGGVSRDPAPVHLRARRLRRRGPQVEAEAVQGPHRRPIRSRCSPRRRPGSRADSPCTGRRAIRSRCPSRRPAR